MTSKQDSGDDSMDAKPAIQSLPEQAQRVETGAVQFGDDWPGVFIRGDNAAAMAIDMVGLLKALPPPESSSIEQLSMRLALQPIYELLRSCVVGPAADMLPTFQRPGRFDLLGRREPTPDSSSEGGGDG